MEDKKNNKRETPSLEKSSVEIQEVPLFSAHPPMVIEDEMMIGVHDVDSKDKKMAKFEIPENNKTENRPPSDRNVKDTAPLNTTKEVDTAKQDPNVVIRNNAFDNIETIPIAKQEEEEKKKILARKDSTQNGEETKDGKGTKNDAKLIAEEKKQNPGSVALAKKSASLKFSTAAEALRRPSSMAKKQTVIVEAIPVPAWKKKITRFVESPLVSIILGLWTIYTLFGDDIRLIGTAKESDSVFFVLTIIAICFFTAEIALSSIATPEYLFGFNFLIDSVCTLTMLMDIGWLWEPVLSKGYSEPESHPVNVALLADASKDARLGYATTIHIRVLRLVRLVRILKIYKYTFSAYDKMKAQDKTDADEIKERAEKDEPGARKNIIEDAKIGNLLSDVTIKRIIFMVIILMFSVPLFSFRSYTSDARSFEFGLDLLANFNDNSNGAAFLQAYDSYLYNHLSYRNPVVLVRAPGKSYDSPTVDFTKLRFNEKEIINPSDSKLHGLYIAVFDLRTDTQMDALLGILQTIFVCLMLAIGGFFFTKDATNLVVAPIEQMMRKIKRIVGNPLEVVNQEEKEAIAYQQKKRAEKIFKKQRCCQKKKEEKMETVMLEQTMTKTGSLLAIGLGEAGHRILFQNVANKTNDGSINPLIPGEKVFAIFGFCDIRNFTDTTEILREEVMVFVNEIADIVHKYTNRYYGSPNKNIGDAFLIVWKFPDEMVETKDGEILPKEMPSVHSLADMAAISFILILAAINKSAKVAKYRENPGLNERMKNYKVEMGFGMNAGWAIEGAIGSEYKIDATYLSSHVNLSMALEEATKIYKSPYVVSEYCYKLFSPEMKGYFRPLDVVVIHNEKITLYTFDVDLSKIEVSTDEEGGGDHESQIMQRIDARTKRDQIRKQVKKNPSFISNMVKTDPDIIKMHSPFTDEFYRLYNQGFNAYVKGDWESAKASLDQANAVRQDYPTTTLLKFMGQKGFKAPEDWKGYHKFNESH